MISEGLKDAEKEFAELFERHEPEVNSRVENSLYNEIMLLSDGMFEKIFRLPYDKLVVNLANEASENHSAEFTQWLQAKNIYYGSLLKRHRKFLPEIDDSINMNEAEEKYYHGLDGKFIYAEGRYAWEIAKRHKYLKQVYQSIRMIVCLKMDFIGQLIEVLEKLNDTSSELKITIGEDHSKILFYFDGSAIELLTMLLELEKHSVLSLSKAGVVKLFSVIRFAKSSNDLGDFTNKLNNNQEKIVWTNPIRRFGDFLRWLTHSKFIMPINHYEKFIEETDTIFLFDKCGVTERKSRLLSLRKSIFNPPPTTKLNTSISDILDPLLNYSEATS